LIHFHISENIKISARRKRAIDRQHTGVTGGRGAPKTARLRRRAIRISIRP
jgi:hypothetical protein